MSPRLRRWLPLRPPPHRPEGAAARAREPARLEELEPRLLYSADALTLASAVLPQEPTTTATVRVAVQPAAPATQAGVEIAYVDRSMPGAQALLDGLQAQIDAGRALEIVSFTEADDGLARLAEALRGRHDVTALHGYTHGDDARLDFGAVALTPDTLPQHAADLATIAQALSPDADWLIYGCDVAASAEGQRFLADLATLSGADIAASTTPTGAEARGGDWTLEWALGPIEHWNALTPAQLAAFDQLLGTPPNAVDDSAIVGTGSTTLDVLANDSGTGTLTVLGYTQPTLGSVSFNANGQAVYTGNTAGVTQFSYTIADATEALTHRWAFDGNFEDSVGSWEGIPGGQGINNKPTLATVDGRSVARFNGDTGVRAGTTTAYLSGAWTLSLDFKGDSLTGNSNVQRYLLSSAEEGGGAGLNVYLEEKDAGGGGRLIVQVTTDRSGSLVTQNFVVANADQLAGGWHRLSLTMTPLGNGSSQARLYLDGAEKLPGTVVALGPTMASTHSLVIGNSAYAAIRQGYGWVQGFKGWIDNVSLQALSDPSGPDSTATATVTLDVRSTGTVTSPQITSPASFTVAEGQTAVGTVTARDADYPVQTLTYAITGGADAALFQIDAATGALSFRSAPDAEQAQDLDINNVYELTVRVSDGSAAAPATQALQITVTDVDETPLAAPTLSGSGSQTLTDNLSGSPTPLPLNLNVTAPKDADLSGRVNQYALAPGSSSLFAVDANTGALSLVGALGPAQRGTHSLVVRVTGGSGPQASTRDSAPIVFTVVADPNEAPVFTGTPGADVLVDENTPASTVLATFTATDTADSVNDSVSFTLGGADAGLFTLDAATGALRLKTTPDYENPPGGKTVYSLTVTASDGAKSSSQAFRVLLRNVNEPPVVVPGPTLALSTPEGTATATVLRSFTATDPEGGPVTWSLAGTDSAMFSIDNTGALRFARSPDFENPRDGNLDNVYDLVVRAQDPLGLQGTTTVAVRVTDVANPPPMFISSGGADDAVINVPQGQLVVIDPIGVTWDVKADAMNLTLLPAPGRTTDVNAFNYNSVNQTLRFNSAPPAGSSFQLILHVEKILPPGEAGPAPFDEQLVTVNVLGGAPVFDGEPSVTYTLPENQGANGAVGTLRAVDPQGDSVIYSLTPSATSALFDINPTTGVLTMKQGVDYETQPRSYSFQAQARDGGGAIGYLNVTVNISDVNEVASVSITSGSATPSQPENSTPLLATLAADDPEKGLITWRIDGPNAALFTLATSGANRELAELRFAAPPDYEVRSSYPVTVTALDSGGNSSSMVMTVSVTNVNEGPVITRTDGLMPNLTVAENTAGGFATFQAMDPESGPVSIALMGPDAGLFTVDGATGALRFNTPPDADDNAAKARNNSYSIELHASDGDLTTVQPLTVQVTPVDEAPVVTRSGPLRIDVAENTVGAVAHFEWRDPEGQPMNVALTGADAAAFSLDLATQTLRFRTPPDFEAVAAGKVYAVSVQATDSAGHVGQADLEVQLTDVDEAPTLQRSDSAEPLPSIRVAENTAGAFAVFAATDPEARPLIWDLAGPDASLFVFDSATRSLRFATPPDADSAEAQGRNNSYRLELTVSDGANTTRQLLTVQVLPVNEAPVQTASFPAEIAYAEDRSDGIVQLVWEDPEDDALTFSLSGPHADRFTLDTATGWLRFAPQTPDYEGSGEPADHRYQVTVVATDAQGQSTPAPLVVVLNDVNEAPQITRTDAPQSPADITVAENTAGPIAQFTAVDPDRNFAGWSLGGSDAALFAIDSGGALRFVTPPDADSAASLARGNRYALTLTAMDSGGLTRTQALSVTVTDVDEPPQIDAQPSPVVVYAEDRSDPIAVFNWRDPEGRPLGVALSGLDAARFQIDAVTGALRFAPQTPDYEGPGEPLDRRYQVTVTVSDPGGQSDATALTVQLADVNEVPAIRRSDAPGVLPDIRVAENTAAPFAHFVADDPEGNFAGWTLGGADAALFAIDSSGALRFVAPPDFDGATAQARGNLYALTLTAIDSAGLSTTQALQVRVTDVDEAPQVSLLGAPPDATETPYAENRSDAVAHFGWSDPEGAALTLSLGGPQADRFRIDTATGALFFAPQTPDFEGSSEPADRRYTVSVIATDPAGNSGSRSLVVQLTDSNEAPVAQRNSGAPLLLSLAENTAQAIAQAPARDPEQQPLQYTLEGPDAARFAIDASGTLHLRDPAGLDYEQDRAADGQRVFQLIVRATDPLGLSSTQALALQLTDVDEAPQWPSGPATFTVAENSVDVATLLPQDPEGQPLRLTLAGPDAAAFIWTADGRLRFAQAPDHEAPGSADGSNRYRLTLRADDGALAAPERTIEVVVVNVNEAPSIVRSDAVGDFVLADEHQQPVLAVFQGIDPDAGSVLQWTLEGADAAHFTLDAQGRLLWAHEPDHDQPADANGDHRFEVTLRVSDGSLEARLPFAVLLQAVNEAPQLQGFSGSETAALQARELSTAPLIQLSATDPDRPAQSLRFLIVGGADAALFTLDADSGVLRFAQAAPAHGHPLDANGDGRYEVQVAVSDGALQAVQRLEIEVLPAPTAPAVLAPPATVEAPPAAPPPPMLWADLGLGLAPPPPPPAENAAPPPTEAAAPAAAPAAEAAAVPAADRPAASPPAGRAGVSPGVVSGANSTWAPAWTAPAPAAVGLSPLAEAAALPALPGQVDSLDAVMVSMDAAQRAGLRQGLDAIRDQVEGHQWTEQIEVASATALTSGLTVGYIVWLIRGGLLVSSMMASLPAWTTIDPLYVLPHTHGDDELGPEGGPDAPANANDDRLERTFEQARRVAQTARDTAQAAATQASGWTLRWPGRGTKD